MRTDAIVCPDCVVSLHTVSVPYECQPAFGPGWFGYRCPGFGCTAVRRRVCGIIGLVRFLGKAPGTSAGEGDGEENAVLLDIWARKE